MKVLAINSSPNAENGCTAKMLSPLLEGMQAAGATTETINLGKLKINHCIACFNCWFKTPGKCIHKDDMAPLIQKYVEADFVIFATPLYVYNVSGMMKVFLDRIIPMALPFFETDESNPSISSHPSRYDNFKSKKVLLVSPCGFPEFDHFKSLVDYIKFLTTRIGGEKAEYVGEILRPAAGMMLNEEAQPIIKPYLDNLKTAGKQLITAGKIDQALHAKLHELFISPEEYRKIVNKYFSEELAKIKQ
jgi:putative NADPH-quinone reductase